MRTRPTIQIYAGRFDFIPIADLFFLLLIFFLVSSSLVFQPGIPVELPKAYGNSMSAAEKIIITVTAEGLIFLNDNPVKDENLPRILRETVRSRLTFVNRRLGLAENDPTPRTRTPKIVVRGDRGVPYQKIVEVMSLARSLGLGVYLVTESENTRAPSVNSADAP